MKRSHKKKIGIKDIAAQAGVSIGTVDRVLHNRGEVKEETRQKVMEIVDELGYTPNILAKSLASKKTRRIAIVIPDSSDNNPYWEKPVKGIKQASDELLSYNAQVTFELFNASDKDSFKQVLDKVIAQDPDGVVLNPVFKEISLDFLTKLDKKGIPYVFIDINLKGANNLGYFGQDAIQSGWVAGKLMNLCTKSSPKILIVKQANRKIFSRHIEARIAGFMNYFAGKSEENLSTQVVEIDLVNPNEPGESLSEVFKKGPSFDGIYVPNSRGFKLADYTNTKLPDEIVTIGYDLVQQNVEHLKEGNITFLLSQKPEVQAYKAIWALFNYLISGKEVNKTNYSSIDIIVKENIEYYYEVTT